MGLIILLVRLGNLVLNTNPNTNGRAMVVNTRRIISKKLILTFFNSGVVLLNIPPQNSKLSGVRITARNEAATVKLIDSATFPFPMEEKKLDKLPPGQAATNIIPNANPCSL